MFDVPGLEVGAFLSADTASNFSEWFSDMRALARSTIDGYQIETVNFARAFNSRDMTAGSLTINAHCKKIRSRYLDSRLITHRLIYFPFPHYQLLICLESIQRECVD